MSSTVAPRSISPGAVSIIPKARPTRPMNASASAGRRCSRTISTTIGQLCTRSGSRATQFTEDKFRRLYLTDAFLEKGVDEISYNDVARWMVEKTRKGSPGAVNHAFQRLNAAMRKAEDWGYRPEGSNPCRGVKQNPRRKMERFLSEQEFARLGIAMRQSRIKRPMHHAALLLLLLTGCRKEEIVGLTWGEVRGARIFLDDSKTGARVVHLCSQAQGILSDLKRGKPADRVFKGQYGGGISMDDYWHRIREDAKLGKVRIHDIRHSYASLAARKAFPLPTIQRLLGHACLDSTARYTHFDDSHLMAIAQRISDLIENVAGRHDNNLTPAIIRGSLSLSLWIGVQTGISPFNLN